ncbi:site-specific integrase [Paenibacillaceae bacterium]|nr:site-specific integrase [Paenibacillaceae bacterium]
MASFQKRGKTWQYCISRMVNGKYDPIRQGGFLRKKEAEVAAAAVEAKLRRQINPELINAKVPFDEYFEDWLLIYKPNIGKNTKARYNNTLESIKEEFEGVYIQDITKRTYQSFLNKYGENRTKATVRKLNSHIRSCVKDAIDEGLIQVDFTRRVTITGKVPSKRPEEKHLDYDESEMLLEGLVDDLNTLSHYLIVLGLTSGMRFAEMVGLTREDFNFENNEIDINKTWGYTNKMHEGFGNTKNDQSKRIITMDEFTMGLFKKMFESFPENPIGLVFYSPSSKYKVISNNAVNKALSLALKKLDIDPITVHGLRHTHASILLYKKVSIYYVSERLGHASIDTTLEHYAHIVKELREEDEESTISTMESMFNKNAS